MPQRTGLVNGSQNPHNDYHQGSGAEKGDELTFICSISEKGTFLVVWKIEDPSSPIILWISYGYGILFQKEMIHAGGLDLSDLFNSVMADPDLGCPRLHFYLVRNNNGIPDNFICY